MSKQQIRSQNRLPASRQTTLNNVTTLSSTVRRWFDKSFHCSKTRIDSFESSSGSVSNKQKPALTKQLLAPTCALTLLYAPAVYETRRQEKSSRQMRRKNSTR